MDIRAYLLKNVKLMDLMRTTMQAELEAMVAKTHAVRIEPAAAEYRKAILCRASESTLGIGVRIAMPHAMHSAVLRALVLFANATMRVAFNALDGQPVHLFFKLAAPVRANNEHLAALAALSSL